MMEAKEIMTLGGKRGQLASSEGLSPNDTSRIQLCPIAPAASFVIAKKIQLNNSSFHHGRLEGKNVEIVIGKLNSWKKLLSAC